MQLLARELARPANGFGFLAVAALRRLLVEAPLLHLAKDAFALHFLLQDAERLVDVVVTDENLQWIPFSGLPEQQARDGVQEA